MKCCDIVENLSLYIDQVLDKEEAQEIASHLESCGACDKIYQDLLAMVGQLNAVEELKLPESFQLTLRRGLKEEAKTNRKSRFNWRFASSIAAVFVIGLLTVGVYNDMIQMVPDKLDYSYEKQVMEEGANQAPLYRDVDESEGIPDEALAPTSTESYSLANTKESSSIMQPTQKKMVSLAPISATGEAVKEEIAVESLDQQEDSGAEYGVTMLDTTGPNRHMNTNKGNMVTGDEKNQCINRNSAAVKYYNNLIADKLAGFSYEVYGCTYKPMGEWHFNAVIFSDAEGNTYDVEVLIIGKNGEITVESEEDIEGL